jgi:hypothetical protein
MAVFTRPAEQHAGAQVVEYQTWAVRVILGIRLIVFKRNLIYRPSAAGTSIEGFPLFLLISWLTYPDLPWGLHQCIISTHVGGG